jgi:hypothetical protein
LTRPGLVAALIGLIAAPASGQTAGTPPPTRLWAAQTTANQITLVWTGAPGATGYLLYRNAGGGGSQGQPRVAALSASVRRYVYIVRPGGQGVEQFHLEATGPRGTSPRVSFNPVTMVAVPVPPVAPASLTATESSPGVVTLTWPAVPGATAYILGRSVGTDGLKRLCDFCSTATTYVDSGVTQGVRHVYTVATLTPSGLSTRATSSPLTPGATTVAGPGGTPGTGGTAVATKLGSQQAIGMLQLLTVLSSATPSTVQGLDLYLFENLVVLTPQAISTAMGQTKGAVGSAAFIDVPYLDAGALQGRYVLHLKVELLP